MPKILIVESDNLLLELIEEWLLLQNFYPLTAKTYQQAYELALREKPDLVLSCYRLLDGSGLELLQTLRKEPKTKTIPFVLITGKPIIEISNYLFKPNAILQKPFLPENLLNVLNIQLYGVKASVA